MTRFTALGGEHPFSPLLYGSGALSTRHSAWQTARHRSAHSPRAQPASRAQTNSLLVLCTPPAACRPWSLGEQCWEAGCCQGQGLATGFTHRCCAVGRAVVAPRCPWQPRSCSLPSLSLYMMWKRIAPLTPHLSSSRQDAATSSLNVSSPSPQILLLSLQLCPAGADCRAGSPLAPLKQAGSSIPRPELCSS